MRKVMAPEAPKAIGPYCHAVVAAGLVATSGQIGLDPQTGDLVPGGISEQTRQAIRNLDAVLKASGSDLVRVIKTTVFLADMADFLSMNTVYAEYFTGNPARSTVAVAGLPKDARVEIECLALVKDE